MQMYLDYHLNFITLELIKVIIHLVCFFEWCNVGVCFKNGQGVTKDLVKAVEYYTLAANLGYAAAQNNLGICRCIEIII